MLIKIIILILFITYKSVFAQQSSIKIVSDILKPEIIFKQAAIDLKGQEFDFTPINIPKGFSRDNLIIIQNPPDFPIQITDLKNDSLHILLLTKQNAPDSTNHKYQSYWEKIYDILTLIVHDENYQFFGNYCEYNGIMDRQIIILARYDEGKEYIDDALRAWRIDRNHKQFVEISPKGIRCKNMAYGD